MDKHGKISYTYKVILIGKSFGEVKMRRDQSQIRKQVAWERSEMKTYQRVVRIEQSLDVMLRVPRGTKLTEDGRAIQWAEDKEQSDTRKYEPSCLQNFLTLTQPTPQKIEQFAQKWGPLVLVEDGDITIEELEDQEDVKRSEQRSRPVPVIHTTPVEAWSNKAQQMAAVIDLVAFLRAKNPEAKENALTAWSILAPSFPFPQADQDEAIKVHLGIIIGSWLDDIKLAPLVAWDGPAFSLRLWLPNNRWASLQAALVLQLVSVISNPERCFRCWWCGRRNFKTYEERITRSGLKPCCSDPKCQSSANSYKSSKSSKKTKSKKAEGVQPAQP